MVRWATAPPATSAMRSLAQCCLRVPVGERCRSGSKGEPACCAPACAAVLLLHEPLEHASCCRAKHEHDNAMHPSCAMPCSMWLAHQSEGTCVGQLHSHYKLTAFHVQQSSSTHQRHDRPVTQACQHYHVQPSLPGCQRLCVICMAALPEGGPPPEVRLACIDLATQIACVFTAIRLTHCLRLSIWPSLPRELQPEVLLARAPGATESCCEQFRC